MLTLSLSTLNENMNTWLKRQEDVTSISPLLPSTTSILSTFLILVLMNQKQTCFAQIPLILSVFSGSCSEVLLLKKMLSSTALSLRPMPLRISPLILNSLISSLLSCLTSRWCSQEWKELKASCRSFLNTPEEHGQGSSISLRTWTSTRNSSSSQCETWKTSSSLSPCTS